MLWMQDQVSIRSSFPFHLLLGRAQRGVADLTSLLPVQVSSKAVRRHSSVAGITS